MDSRVREFPGETSYDSPFGIVLGAPLKGYETSKMFSTLARSCLQLTCACFVLRIFFCATEPDKGRTKGVKFDNRGWEMSIDDTNRET